MAYHSACSLQHGQRVLREPKELLSKMGFAVKDVPEAHLCCGSAGVYNILQPEIADRLRARKIENIARVEPDVIAAGNIGCITQIAAGTATLNHYIERESDRFMRRTASRPLPSGQLQPREALWFGVILCIAGAIDLYFTAGFLASALAVLTCLSYLLAYTPLKKRTVWATAVGAFPGAIPPMIGWAAATGGISVESFVLFLIIFVWTPPHFWALALLRTRDYAKAGIPMLPVVSGPDATRKQILIYSLILAPVGMVPAIIGPGGTLYAAVAAILGALFVVMAFDCYSKREGEEADRAAKNLFAYSVLYLFLLFAALLVERGFGIDGSSLPSLWAS